jgi:hypothetical protein
MDLMPPPRPSVQTQPEGRGLKKRGARKLEKKKKTREGKEDPREGGRREGGAEGQEGRIKERSGRGKGGVGGKVGGDGGRWEGGGRKRKGDQELKRRGMRRQKRQKPARFLFWSDGEVCLRFFSIVGMRVAPPSKR